jgi:sulfoquinovosyltransferase
MRLRMMGNRTDNPFLLVYIGRVAAEKRIHDLKIVMERLPADYHLCIVGSGPEEANLHNLFLDDSTTVNRTTFLGYMDGLELSQAFASADLFVMPSDSETLGFVVLESMASGVPVVGVKAGGVAGLINDGVTGFLYEQNDLQTFVDRIVTLKNDPKMKAKMSEEGRKETLKWSWTESLNELRTKHYVEAIKNFENRYDTRIRKMLGLYKPKGDKKTD